MGNRFVFCKQRCCMGIGPAADDGHRDVIRVVRLDRKIVEFRAPILVKDLLVQFPGLSVLPKGQLLMKNLQDSKRLSLKHELKMGKIYYLLPSSASLGPDGLAPSRAEEVVGKVGATGIKRSIRVVIRKQQLQDLMLKQSSVEEVLAGLVRKARHSAESLPTSWRPELETIPEGSELPASMVK